jgi:hypothetical protein
MFNKLLQRTRNSKSLCVIILFFILIFVLIGCASKTQIRSRPEGAEVYIDNVKKGRTPLDYEDTAAAGSTKHLKLKLDGYESFETVLRKSEFQWGPCIGGGLVLFPFIWVLGYPDTYEFELHKLAGVDKKVPVETPIITEKEKQKTPDTEKKAPADQTKVPEAEKKN